jgi:hypothetical protein
MGGSEPEDRDPSLERMRYHLSSFDPEDREHTSVTLIHRPSRWGLAVFEDGLVILENIGSGIPPRHIRVTDREKILSLWQQLARGDLDSVMKEAWLPGYGSE